MFSVSKKMRAALVVATSIALCAATLSVPAIAVTERSLPSGDYLYDIDCSGAHLQSLDVHDARSQYMGDGNQIEGSTCGYQGAFNKITDTAYYLAGNNNEEIWPLATVDLATGEQSLVGNIFYINENNEPALFTGGIGAVAISDRGDAAFIYNNTLYGLNLETGEATTTSVDLSSFQSTIYAAAFDSNGNLYFLSEDGHLGSINAYNPDLLQLIDAGTLPAAFNYSLQIDSSGMFWVVSNGGDLASFNVSDIEGTYEVSGRLSPYSGSLLLTTVAPALYWTDNQLANAQINTEYRDSLAVQSSGAYEYMIIEGGLPDGLSLDPQTGLISGTPTTIEAAFFVIKVVNDLTSIDLEFTIYVQTDVIRTCVDYSDASYLGPILLNPDGTVIGCDLTNQPEEMLPTDWQSKFSAMMNNTQHFEEVPTEQLQPYSLRQGVSCDDCNVGADGVAFGGDVSEQGLPLGFGLNFFGTTYDSVFVNSNGSISFGRGSSEYSKPLENILNGEAGVVAYGLDLMNSEISTINSPWGEDRHSDFFYWGKTTYEGHEAFVATWVNQLTYPSDVENTDFSSYQIILVDRDSGDGNIIINYGSMSSTTGNGYGLQSNFPYESDQAGCMSEGQNCVPAGIGTIVDGYPLYASLQDDNGILYNGRDITELADGGNYALSQGHLNSSIPGQFIFEMRSGTVAEAATTPGIPREVEASPGDNSTINVTWLEPETDGGSPITSYVVQYRFLGNSGPWRELASSSTSAVIGDMPLGNYEIKVAAVNGMGSGYFSNTETSVGGVAMAPVWNDEFFPTFQVGVETDLLFGAISASPVYYQIMDGDLPDGVSFDNNTGQFSGTPTTEVPYAFIIQAENEDGITTFTVNDRVRSTNPYLVNDSPVELNPGAFVIYNDDFEDDAYSRTIINHDAGGNDLLLHGDSGELRLTGSCEAGTRCQVVEDDNGNQVLTLFAGGSVTVSGNGFMPGTTVFVYANSAPRLLGSVRVLRNGTYSASFSLAGLGAGNHTLQARGVGPMGAERAENMGVVVTAQPTNNQGSSTAANSEDLVHTGSNIEQLLLAALLITSLGIAMRMLSIRRKS